MSHFYGTLQGSRGEATRCGTKSSGIETIAASWDGAVKVQMWWDESIGENRYRVQIIPWGGISVPPNSGTIAEGIMGEKPPHGESYAEIL